MPTMGGAYMGTAPGGWPWGGSGHIWNAVCVCNEGERQRVLAPSRHGETHGIMQNAGCGAPGRNRNPPKASNSNWQADRKGHSRNFAVMQTCSCLAPHAKRRYKSKCVARAGERGVSQRKNTANPRHNRADNDSAANNSNLRREAG